MRNNNQWAFLRRGKPWISSRCALANEVGAKAKQGGRGDLASREAGSVGGQIAGKMWPVRTKNTSEITAIHGDIGLKLLTML